MKTSRNIIFLMFLCVLIGFVSGCANGPGINRHEFFVSENPEKLHLKVELDEKTRSVESIATFDENSMQTAYGVFAGVPEFFLNPILVKSTRGSFKSGSVFEEAARTLSDSNENSEDWIRFEFVQLQQYVFMGAFPGLQSILRFKAHLNGSSEATLSEYACNWHWPYMILGPQMEKDMLREMIESSVNHWARGFNSEYVVDSNGKRKFPPQSTGQISEKEVECGFNLFQADSI